MNIYNDNKKYIKSTIANNARRLMKITGSFQDVDDFKQEMYLELFKAMPKFDKKKSSQHTFISRIVRFASGHILSKRYTKKNLMIINAEQYQDDPADDGPDENY